VPSAAAASQSQVTSAVRDVLAKGNAVDGVIAGVLAAAADTPSVLLGPVQLLAGGAGAGLVAVDGRTQQPGRGAPRPRGFLSDEPVPEAASVAAPLLLSALAAAHASLGSATLYRVCAPAVALAKERSPERARVFSAFARRGAPALAEDLIAAELLAAAGRAARGLLTVDDLTVGRPRVVRCDERTLGPGGLLTAPWRGSDRLDASATQVIVAADTRGLVACACYEAPLDGVRVPGLDLIAPRNADPVMRGRTRVSPGEPRPAPAPIALRAAQGMIDLALAVAETADGEEALVAMTAALSEGAVAAEVLPRASGHAFVLVRARDGGARVIAR
jgi:gamma-glutamyltranspeptidase/glutathione hydrolase